MTPDSKDVEPGGNLLRKIREQVSGAAVTPREWRGDEQLRRLREGLQSASEVPEGFGGDARQPKSRRRAIPRWQLEKAVELLTKGEGRNEVARRTGLTPHVVGQLIKDLKAGTGLRWSKEDRLGLPEDTLPTPDGLILPERRNRAR